MADAEVTPTEFQLDVAVSFEAKDVTGGLTPLEVIDLIEEIDAELDSWEATVLLARYFARAAENAPDELLTSTDEALALAIDASEEVAE